MKLEDLTIGQLLKAVRENGKHKVVIDQDYVSVHHISSLGIIGSIGLGPIKQIPEVKALLESGGEAKLKPVLPIDAAKLPNMKIDEELEKVIKLVQGVIYGERTAIIDPHYDSNGYLDGGCYIEKGRVTSHIDPRGETGLSGEDGIEHDIQKVVDKVDSQDYDQGIKRAEQEDKIAQSQPEQLTEAGIAFMEKMKAEQYEQYGKQKEQKLLFGEKLSGPTDADVTKLNRDWEEAGGLPKGSVAGCGGVVGMGENTVTGSEIPSGENSDISNSTEGTTGTVGSIGDPGINLSEPLRPEDMEVQDFEQTVIDYIVEINKGLLKQPKGKRQYHVVLEIPDIPSTVYKEIKRRYKAEGWKHIGMYTCPGGIKIQFDR